MAEPIRLPKKLSKKDSFQVSSFMTNRWAAILDEDMTLEDALEPTFWAHKADQISGSNKASPKGIGDIIEVRNFDRSEYAELLVREVGPGFVKVKVLRSFGDDAPTLAADCPLQFTWNVGRRSYDVTRKTDKSVVSQGHPTKDAAVRWIASHLKAMAA
jgi:hypothetical protein